jgi:aminoglycoside phosphotransferase (APT) family kinase protein
MVATLTSASAVEVMEASCDAIGAPSANAKLLRLGENAIFEIPERELVIRIARGPDVMADARKEVAVARWLHENGVCAVRPAAVEHQPIDIDGHPVTFWEFIRGTGKKASVADLGRALRQIHSLDPPKSFPLPPFQIFGRVESRLQRASDVSANDVSFLRDRLGRLRVAYKELHEEAKRPLHGDAHIQNLIVQPNGDAVLIDLEGFALGAPETDLCVTATEFEIGWHTEADYKLFCETYGRDVREWQGYPILKEINQLKMTTWLMQNIADGPEVEDEFRVRLATLRDGKAPRRWRPF